MRCSIRAPGVRAAASATSIRKASFARNNGALAALNPERLGGETMATRKKTAKARTKVAAKKSAKKVVKLKAVKKPAAKAAKASNGNGLPRPSSKAWGQA